MCIIGVCVSCVAWVLKMSVEESTIFFTHHLEHLLDNSKSSDSDIAVVYAWFFAVGWSVCWAVLASLLVVVGHPPASGSGVPEVIGYLNGVDIKEIISIRTFVVKLFSCIFINISGLPVGAAYYSSPAGRPRHQLRAQYHLSLRGGSGGQTNQHNARLSLPSPRLSSSCPARRWPRLWARFRSSRSGTVTCAARTWWFFTQRWSPGW